MKHPKGSTAGKKVLWRMSEAVPQGEFIDVDSTAAVSARKAKPAAAPGSPAVSEVSHSNWQESSFELLRGTEVNDGPDTVPDDLFDALFAPSAVPQEPPTEQGTDRTTISDK